LPGTAGGLLVSCLGAVGDGSVDATDSTATDDGCVAKCRAPPSGSGELLLPIGPLVLRSSTSTWLGLACDLEAALLRPRSLFFLSADDDSGSMGASEDDDPPSCDWALPKRTTAPEQ